MKDWPPHQLMGILSTVSSEAMRSSDSQVLIEINDSVFHIDVTLVQIQDSIERQVGAPDWSIDNE